MASKSKGLGDSIERITKATGIKAVVDKVSELTGIDCKCEERKEALNKLYPYSRQFTEDEMKIYEQVLPRIHDRITAQDQAIMVKLYNKVFNANKKPSSCGSCVQGTLKKLEAVYQNSCKNENTH
jgi:hypothetical protein|tara:strand:- start:410 stop:784 length:375 start_codon:yes stop_codon:yes gene_type:complete